MSEPRGIDPTKPYLNLTRSLADVYEIEQRWYGDGRMWFVWTPKNVHTLSPLNVDADRNAQGTEKRLAAQAEPVVTV
jgi:hypothetical protein